MARADLLDVLLAQAFLLFLTVELLRKVGLTLLRGWEGEGSERGQGGGERMKRESVGLCTERERERARARASERASERETRTCWSGCSLISASRRLCTKICTSIDRKHAAQKVRAVSLSCSLIITLSVNQHYIYYIPRRSSLSHTYTHTHLKALCLLRACMLTCLPARFCGGFR